MKLKSVLLSLFTAALFFLPTGIGAEMETNASEEYIIALEDGVTATDAFIEKYDLIPVNEEHGIYVTSEENAAMLENHSKVDIVEENSYVTLFYDYNDTYYSKQKNSFNLINGSELNGYYVNRMAKVVVIDTGFNFNHEDKGLNIRPGSDIVRGTNAYGQYYQTTKDYFTHGTACAGIIGAQANNYKGIAGINNNCYIYVSSIFHTNDKGEAKASDANVCAAIYDAVDNLDADVISMSFGQSSNSKVIADAIQYAYSKNVLLIASSGNSGDDDNFINYPASLNGVISVANAKDSNSTNPSSTYNQYVDVAAPGTSIYNLNANGSYKSGSGTSYSAPFVSALAAYAKGAYPDMTPSTFEWYLKRSAKDMGITGKDNYTGYGMIDCAKFHSMITSGTLQTGEPSSPFIINNATDLEIFFSIVSNGDTDACATINQSFTVHSNFKVYTGTYNGTLNGANHRISGLKATFIDTLGPNGRIQNLYINGSMTDESILVRENKGTIYGCVTEGSLTNNNSTAGGICAVNRGYIYYALNRATVTGAVAAGIAPYSYGAIDQAINRGKIESTAGTAAGICVYLHDGGSVSNSYNASALKGISNLGGVVHTMASSAKVKNCYYGDSKQRTTTHNEIVAKTYDYMRTRGFLCMLNGHGGYFKADSNNTNDGFPVWGSSDISTCFYDVAPHKWSADDIYALAADQILNGRSQGYFVPEDNITRAEFLTILAKINGIDITNGYYGTEPFYDVSPNDWYYNVICWAYNSGLTKGNGNGSCTPTANITREEISAFIVRYIQSYSTNQLPTPKALTFTDSYKVSSWAVNDVSILNQLGIINGFPDGSFGPKQPATREQAAKMTNAMRNEI